MPDASSQRRMAENEVVFRQHNERIQQGFNVLERLAKKEGHESLVDRDDRALHFYCECADEQCRKRVKLKPSLYNKIHEQRDQFVVVCGHESPDVESIVNKTDTFCVVQKFQTPPQHATKLNKTNVDNT